MFLKIHLGPFERIPRNFNGIWGKNRVLEMGAGKETLTLASPRVLGEETDQQRGRVLWLTTDSRKLTAIPRSDLAKTPRILPRAISPPVGNSRVSRQHLKPKR
jgi:hypothetical protein